MRELKAKVLSVMLAVCMVFTLLPVSASAEEGSESEAVEAVVKGVTLTADKTEVKVDETVTLTATVSGNNLTAASVSANKLTWDIDGEAIEWEDPSVDVNAEKDTATVTREGKATSAGEVTVKVTIDGNESEVVTFTVEPAAPSVSANKVTGVSLDKDKLDLEVGKSEILTATVAPANADNKKVNWESSKPDVATVENGTVKALKAGTATITVKTEDGGFTATCTVTVKEKAQNTPGTPNKVAVKKVTLNKSKLELVAGKTSTLKATVTPKDATNKTVTWKSSDTKVATVNKNGKVTAKKAGTATITATADGKKATCKVTVYAKNKATLKTKDATYKVTGKGVVAYAGPAKKTATKASIPATIKVGKVTYKVTSVADNAFKNCKKITKVTIGTNVEKIGKNAFSGCSKLKTITIKTKKLKTVGKNAFKGIDKKATIKVPSSKLKAYQKILKSKGQAKTVKIKK